MDKIERWRNTMDGYYDNSSREQLEKNLNSSGFIAVPIPSIDWDEIDKRNEDLMDIYSEEGTKVKYIAENGWDGDVPYANKYLTKREIYTVDYVDVGGSCSYVTLKEFPDRRFNTVMFEEVK